MEIHINLTKMHFINAFTKKVMAFLLAFCLAFVITLIVFNISFKIALLQKLQKELNEQYDDDPFDSRPYEDYIDSKHKPTFARVDNIKNIKKMVEKLNEEQTIFNEDKHGPVRSTTVVFVIKVHDNIPFLKVLIRSLKRVLGISNALLIFFHDIYDPHINSAIREINFAKFMQVFYPYSNQLFPKTFPGADPQFCSGDLNCYEDTEHQRNYPNVQLKHYWWWHMSFVFDHLQALQSYNKTIIFLEENQFVLSDILFMLKVLVTLMPESCPQCEIMSFGAHTPELLQYHPINGKVLIEYWDATSANIGISFNRTVWNGIKNNSQHFCQFDDSRWEASLDYLAGKRHQGPFVMLTSYAPRVLRIKTCDGIITDCSVIRSIEDVQRFARMVHRGLYPQSFIVSTELNSVKNVTAIGDWKDVRDLALCKHFTETNNSFP